MMYELIFQIVNPPSFDSFYNNGFMKDMLLLAVCLERNSEQKPRAVRKLFQKGLLSHHLTRHRGEFLPYFGLGLVFAFHYLPCLFWQYLAICLPAQAVVFLCSVSLRLNHHVFLRDTSTQRTRITSVHILLYSVDVNTKLFR